MNFMCARCLGDHINGTYRNSSKSYSIIASWWTSAISSGQSCNTAIRTVYELEIMSTN